MKKLKHLVLTLIQKLKRKQKTWQFSDTDNNLKFSKGDFVRIFPEPDGIWSVSFTGKIIDYESGLKEPVYIVETYSSNLRFPESALKNNNPDDERDWKIKQVLK
jgi:hypothetical protein